MSIGSHQSSRMVSDVWLTPPAIIQALGPFDLDPCAAPEPRPWGTAAQHIAKPADGLSSPWQGHVWLNPPYSRDAVHWLRRLAAHGDGIALTFARTETEWFFETVWRAPTATAALWLDGRLHFHYQDGTRAPANSGAPSVLIAYGNKVAASLLRSGLPGAFTWLSRAAS